MKILKRVIADLTTITHPDNVATKRLTDQISDTIRQAPVESADEMHIPVKRYDILDVIDTAVKFYGSNVVNRSSMPPEVSVKGDPKIPELNSLLAKKFASSPDKPKAVVLRKTNEYTVVSLGV